MKRTAKPKPATLDLSYMRAATLLPGDLSSIRIMLVGCGGTGGWLAPSIARLARVLTDAGRSVDVFFIDHDKVEDTNIPRQNFCPAEIGYHKAVTLAARYSLAWNVEIGAIPDKFTLELFAKLARWDTLNLIIGGVDNAAARRIFAGCLTDNIKQPGRRKVWWLDCGNHEEAGQVLIGSAPRSTSGAFVGKGVCTQLPAPSLQMPDLLVPGKRETGADKLSCAEIALLNAQSLMVNQRVAAEAADMLLRFCTGKLTRMATYFDLASGTSKSVYITLEEVSKYHAKLKAKAA